MDTKTYKIENNLIVGIVDGIEAVRQSVDKMLNTERFEHVIYSDDYGVEFSSLIGESFGLVEAELERVISEALLVDDRIVELTNFTFEKTKTNAARASFVVQTVFGDISLEREWETDA